MAMPPRRNIRKLDKNVVDKIAAGEVVISPANALKEIIENSLDAKATSIKILVKAGGIKLLQVQDDGTGILKDDLDIICERFTTSKLGKFEELSNIGTYGFRGEALASISHIAHLTIISKTDDSSCAYRATYKKGKLIESPTSCAANTGTKIIVEDLFYNMKNRKNALKSPSEEYLKILEIVSRYAVHNANVGFTLKKDEENANEIKTLPGSTPHDNISVFFGSDLTRQLVEIECKDDTLNFQAKALISDINFSMKKMCFLLFINNRLVESSLIKQEIDSIYSSYLPKNEFPFIYLRLDVSPHNIDVNVHPTKHEVRFLYEEEITKIITQAIDEKFFGSNAARAYLAQTLLVPLAPSTKSTTDVSATSSNTSAKEKKVSDRTLVRTDSKEQKLDAFLRHGKLGQGHDNKQPVKQTADRSKNQEERVIVQLMSVLNLRKEITNACHAGLHEIVNKHIFVGCVERKYALFQHQTKLYIANTIALSEELFYQLLLKDFGNFGALRMSNPLSLFELSMTALDAKDSKWCEAHGPKEDIAKHVVKLLQSKAEMLDEYFSIEIDENGNLCTLPIVLHNYLPNIVKLPIYIIHLATKVEWTLEKECFETICRETAHFFAISEEPDCFVSDKDEEEKTNEKKKFRWTIEHVIYPALKSDLLPPNHFFDDKIIQEAADLPVLYATFERC